MEKIEIGQILTCNETGKAFVASVDGCSVNYARDSKGYIYSDEGVDIREKREMLDRSKPFSCYLSCDGKKVTGWKGNALGFVTYGYEGKRTNWGRWQYVRVRDIHGGLWYGRNGGRGCCITLRPVK